MRRGACVEARNQAFKEKPAVRQPGEVVGACLAVAVRERAKLTERIAGPDYGDNQGRRGEDHADPEDRMCGGVYHDAERTQEEQYGHEVRRLNHRSASDACARALPRAESHQERGDRPQAVERRSRDVGARRHAQEVDAVCSGEQQEPRAERPPEAAGTPASYGEDADDHADENDVPDRVCDVRRDGCEVAVDPLGDRADDQCDLECRDPERRDQRVHPDGLGAIRHCLAYQQADPQERERIVRQKREVGDRWGRNRIEILNHGSEQHRSRGEADKAGCECCPTPATRTPRDRARSTEQRAAGISDVLDPDVKEGNGCAVRTKDRRCHKRQDERPGENLQGSHAARHSAASGPMTRSESVQR